MNWSHQERDEHSKMHQQHSPDRKGGIRAGSRCFTLDKDSYTSGQAARLLDIPARTLRRYLSIGKIEGIQNPITQTWQISAEALSRFIQSQGGEVVIADQELIALVIEGKSQVADLLKRYSEQRYPNLKVKYFQEVGDALIESGVQTPDLIIIDVNTPFYDGPGLLKLLRSNPHTSSSKILALSDESDTSTDLDAMGATTTLVKPFSYNDLAQTLMYMFPISAQLPS